MDLKKKPGKVNLNEVEEKLEAMKLKRLTRISTLELGQPVLALTEESQSHTAPALARRQIPKLIPKGKIAPIPPKPGFKPQPPPPSQKSVHQSAGAISKTFKKAPAPQRPPAKLPKEHTYEKLLEESVYDKPLYQSAYENPASISNLPKPNAKPPTKEEKILKKLQRNWVALNEILSSNSPVDADEMEDLKNSLVEGEELLERYRCRMKALQARRSPGGSINRALEEIRGEIATFKGLKRDEGYRLIMGKLKDCLTVCEMCYHERVSEVKAYEKLLEKKVTKQELILMNVLQEQADDIYNRHNKSTQ